MSNYRKATAAEKGVNSEYCLARLAKPACLAEAGVLKLRAMGLPLTPITLAPEQVSELNRKLADMRHNVNNYLSLVTAAAEIVARKPDMAERLMATLIEQPNRIIEEIRKFSDDFEKTVGTSFR